MVMHSLDTRSASRSHALAGLTGWPILVAILAALVTGLLAGPAHAQQRRPAAAVAASPMDGLAARLGLVVSPATRTTAANVQSTGNTRTWTNLQIRNEAGVPTSIATVTLEALGPVVTPESQFRLVLADVTDQGGKVARIELVGAFAGTGSLPGSELLEIASYKGFVGTVAISGLESRDGDDLVTMARLDATFVPGGPDGGRLSGITVADIRVKTTLDPSEAAQGETDAAAEAASDASEPAAPLEISLAGMALTGLNEQAASLLSDARTDSLDLNVDLKDRERIATARQAAFERFEFTGLQMVIGDATAGFGRFAITGFDPQRVALIELTDVIARYKESEPEEGSFLGASEVVFRTGRFAISGIKTQAMLTAMAAIDGDEEAQATPVARDFPAGPLDGVFEGFEISAVSLGLADSAVSMDRFAYQLVRDPDGFVSASAMQPMTLKLTVGDGAGSIPQMEQVRAMMITILGEPEFRLRFAGTSQMDRTTGVMSSRDSMITIQDGFDIGLDWAFGGLDRAYAVMTYKEWLGLAALEAELGNQPEGPDGADPAAESDAADGGDAAVAADAVAAASEAAGEADGSNPEPAGGDIVGTMMARSNPWTQIREGTPSVFEHVTVISGRLVITDRGLLERVFTGAATLSGEAAATMRNELAQGLERSGGDSDWRDLQRKAARFIRSGGTLSIAYAPAQPLALRDVETEGAFRAADIRTIWRDPRAK
jgi:hypothetical protein